MVFHENISRLMGKDEDEWRCEEYQFDREKRERDHGHGLSNGALSHMSSVHWPCSQLTTFSAAWSGTWSRDIPGITCGHIMHSPPWMCRGQRRIYKGNKDWIKKDMRFHATFCLENLKAYPMLFMHEPTDIEPILPDKYASVSLRVLITHIQCC